MKRSLSTIILIFLFGSLTQAQSIPADSLYLGQTPPGNTPLIFNLSVNTGSFAAERIAISNDGSEIYYSEVHSYYPTAGDTIKYYRYSGNKWTGPFKLFNGYTSPSLSPGGDTMYFQNDTMYLPNYNTVYRTFLSTNNDTNWSLPQRILPNLNSVHYFQETNNGDYYVSSNSNPGIGASDWCKLFINGADSTAVSLGLPLNSSRDDLDLYVSRDNSFVIVAKNSGNVTKLHISYRNNSGNWTNPKNLGPTINFGLGAWGPFVSSDNKYLFYTAGTNPDYSDTHVYWVRIDGLIDSLKHTNFTPYLKTKIENKTDSAGHLFNFKIPDSTFIDDDGNNTLTYGAKLTNGNTLPEWLSFDSINGVFSGMPAIVETLNIKVTVTDNAGATAFTTFKVIIKNPATDSLYLFQTKPGNIPEIFYLSVGAGLFAAERIAISNDGREIYYQELDGYSGTVCRIKKYRFSGGQWTGPITQFEDFVSPALNVSSDTMYVENNNEAYFSLRDGFNWTNPRRMLAGLNTVHYLQQTYNQHYYASSKPSPGVGASDWCKLIINASDTTSVSIGLPLNSAGDDLDFYVSREETFMIVAKNMDNTTKLCISYHKTDNSWTNPKSLGSTINFGLGMWGPYVSADNKYLFYSTGTKPDYSDVHVYWVQIDNLADSLMSTNFIPYVKTKIEDQTDTVGYLFNYTVPETTFIDDDGNKTLVYGANLNNGDPLPEWLSFDTITGTFSGMPLIAETLYIKVAATDNAGASVSTSFKISIKASTAINQNKEQNVKIFPNPTSGLINISINSSANRNAIAEVYNIQGKVIRTNSFKDSIHLDMTNSPKGVYILKLHFNDVTTVRKICIQ